MDKIKQKELPKLIAKYSMCFLVFAFFCVIIIFLADGKSMMDHVDGTFGHYNGFVNGGNVLRTFFRNIFVNHIFEFPMWDMTIGMGSDLLITFNPFATPLLSLISSFVPTEYSEYVFNLIVIIRLYLSGLAFLFFAHEKEYKNINAIAGALVYVFSSTTFIVFMQLSFSITYILFPLLLLGADRVWKNKKSLLYVVVLTYSIILYYYFTYMMLILLVVYCVIRFFCEEGRSIKKFFSLFGKFVVLTLISLITGFGMVLPSVLNLTGLNRLKTHYSMALIDLEVLKRIFFYGFTCIQADGDALIGVSSFAIIAVVCLFATRKKNTVIKWCLSLCLLSFAFPFIGSVFNGFNYVSFRYIFALIMCVSYVVTVSFDSIKEFKGKIWYFSLGISAIYGAVCFFFVDSYSALSAISLLLSVFLVGLINTLDRQLKQFREKLYLTVILISCIIIGYSCCHTSLGPSMMDIGTIYDLVINNDGMNLRKEVNDPAYRTDLINADFADTVMNSSMAAGVSGFDFYCNNQDQFIERYYTSLEVLSNPMEFSHTGFRCRCYTEIMNACNYIVRSDKIPTCIRAPYTYELVKKQGDYSLYKSGKGVSLVYFYDNVISNESYMDMNPLMRETNLMYSMVVDEPKQPEADIVSDLVSIPFEIDNTKNVIIDGNKIIVQEDKAYITLKTDPIEAGQISIYLTGLRNSDVNNWHFRNSVALLDSDNNMIVADYSALCPTTDKYYYGNDDIVFSFESVDENIDKIGLIFFDKGEYNLDDIQIYSRPYKQMDQTLEAFYEHADMEDISYDYSGNHLSISATADSDRYLYIAIPYSKGWSAKVDGRPAEVTRTNIAFMSIPVTSGTHNIELTYRTPHLYLGWTISAIGLLLIIGYTFYENKKRIRAS